MTTAGSVPRIVYLVSHPIQYQAPLLRRLSTDSDTDLQVVFTQGAATKRFDEGFGIEVAYDVPLLDGYSWSPFSWTSLWALVSQADILWFHGWSGGRQTAAFLLAWVRRRPILMRCETWEGAYGDTPLWRRQVRRLVHRMVFARCSAFLPIGTQNREYMESLGCPSEKMFMMPYVVDNERFSNAACRESAIELRESLGIGTSEPVILYAGKLSRRKLADVLLEAWKEGDWDSTAPQLVIAGDGELRAELEESATTSGVHFTGFVNQSELPALYGAADVFVLAAQNEPWGLAANEAMASGTAVVLSDEVGAAADLVDRDTGRVVAAGDGRALVEALKEVLRDSDRMGAMARRRIQGWGLDACASGFDSAVRFVLGSHGPSH